MKLKLSQIKLLLTLVVLMILPLTHCFLGSPDYTLTVIVGEGIFGTPESGTYEYPEFTEVTFGYQQEEGMNIPQVYIDNSPATQPQGTIIMYNDIELRVEQLDIRGQWEFVLKEGDAEILTITITIAGENIYSGTITDDRGFTGTWTVEGDILTIIFQNWVDYEFEGFANIMEGTWKGEGMVGTWKAETVR